MNNQGKSEVKIEAILRGGLGNQLFQFAFLRNIQIQTRGNLSIDTFLGFRTDYRYQNKFQLSGLLVNNRKPELARSIELAIVEKIALHLSRQSALNYLRARRCEYIFDRETRFMAPSLRLEFPSVFTQGYWQSNLYFRENDSLVGNEIASWLRKVAARSQLETNGTRVGIGVRTYSETKDPTFYSRGGLIKNSDNWQLAIDRVIDERENVKFVLFTRDTRDLINFKLNFRGAPFVIHDCTGKTPAEVMFDFALCDHHVFNNSTFYWWGAYLHKFIKPNTKQNVLTSDNYLNVDAIPKAWNRF